MFTDIDEEPTLAESANSVSDGDSGSHVLLTVQCSNCIASKFARTVGDPGIFFFFFFDINNLYSGVL